MLNIKPGSGDIYKPIRSQSNTRHHRTPYSTSELPRVSGCTAQARLHRSDDYWNPSQSLAAATYANAGELDKYGSSNQGTPPSSTTQYGERSSTGHQVTTPPSQNYPPPSFGVPFAPETAPHNFGDFRSALEAPTHAIGSSLDPPGAPRSPFHPAPHDFLQPRPQPHASHFLTFPLVADTAPSTSETNAPLGFPQYRLPSIEHTMVQQEGFIDSSLGNGLQFNTYRSNMPTSSYLNPTDHANSTDTHPLHTQQYPFSYPPIDSGRRDSVSSTAAQDTNYPVQYGQGDEYLQPSGQSLVLDASRPSTLPSPPETFGLSRSSPRSTHTATPYQRASSSVEYETPQAKASTTTSLPGVGSAESVRRRLNIMYDSQHQQSEQTERSHVLRKALAKKSASRQRKSNQTDESELDDANPASKHKDAAARYKSAYERVRLQRDFYEGATSSLLHQVRMLGGDPMQASKRASKGENLDPKRARLVIASLQQALENSREKLIETQTELHSLRQTYDDTSQSYPSGLSDDYLKDEDNETPLSAAPFTVYNHHGK